MWIIPFPQLFQITCYGFGYFSTNFHCKKKKYHIGKDMDIFFEAIEQLQFGWSDSLPACLLAASVWQYPGGTIPSYWEGISSIYGVSWGHTLKTIGEELHTDLTNTDLNSLHKFMCVHFTQRLLNLISKHSSDLPSFPRSQLHPGLI